ncbi:probable pectinesterase/pectinesterase inhibitor 41 [Olea europaea var. sylvestris]|uniref:probable pectinesterase/pectinesterase inhibitor 41 n=1 Tax=Olea europaea var. sylvestris TaxID=158386 RepID=UPI000C1D2713|nr:probable pectinesterase/pectinesterase inhibitor 41 [Olea europaea var. sylvestris]
MCVYTIYKNKFYIYNSAIHFFHVKMMKNKLFSSPLIISCIILAILTLSTHSSADNVSPANPIPPSIICKSTPYPGFCKSMLVPNSNSSSNAYDHSLFSVQKSLSAARKFLSLINKYLRGSRNLTITAVRALDDCKFLAELNIDYLMSSFVIVNGTSSKTLSVFEADEVQTLLSSILTNSQTCVDGLQATASAWSVRKGILSPLTNDTRLFSVSLALFTKASVPKRKKPSHSTGKHLTFQNGRLNFKMSAKNQEILNVFSNRRLLQTDDNDN